MSVFELTEREIEVAKLVCSGLRNNDIGDRLFITGRTVKYHINSIYNKLGVNNRVQMLIMMENHEIVPIKTEKSEFTPRERQVCELISRGWTDREIAHALYVSPSTVKNFCSILYNKIQLISGNRRVQLAVWWIEEGREKFGFDPFDFDCQ